MYRSYLKLVGLFGILHHMVNYISCSGIGQYDIKQRAF